MKDADALGRLKAGDDLQDTVHCVAGRQRASRAHAVLECAPSHKLHGDDRRPADFLGTEDVHAVRMVDRSGQPAFAEKPLARFGRIERVTQNFERDTASALQVFGLEHGAHSAFAQEADDLVMPKLLTGLGQPAGPRLRSAQRVGAVWARDRLRLHRSLEEAFRTKVNRNVAGKRRTALGASTRRRR